MYTQGPFGILGFLKRLLCFALRLFKPFPSPPFSHGEMKLWALKNAAIATQTLMLALSAAGYDSCPLDGCDKGRIRKLLGLPRGAHLLLVLAVGIRAESDGRWGSRIRLPREDLVSVA